MLQESQKFADISFIDDEFQGIVIGIHSVHVYKSCPTCRASMKTDGTEGVNVKVKCQRCFNEVAKANEDFKFSMVLEKDDSNETTIIGFKSALGSNVPMLNGVSDSGDVERALNADFEGQRVQVSVTANFGEEPNDIIQELTFL